MKTNKKTRRNFVLFSLAAASGVMASCSHYISEQNIEVTKDVIKSPLPSLPPLPTRILGNTGITIPILGLGGAACPLSEGGKERESYAILERAYELGLRYFDTAASYGQSEERIGKTLSAYRKNIIIATKTGSRDAEGAKRDLERSLNLLKTDYLDLWQFHGLTHSWDIDTILDPKNGAMQVAQKAKQEGKVLHIGISGHHNPEIIIEALGRYAFDTILIPINAADIHNPSSFIKMVLPLAKEKNIGVIAMKVPAYGRLFKPGVLDGMHQALGYALSQLGVTCSIISADTLEQLETNIIVARQFKTLSASDLKNIEERTASVWRENSFFRDWG